MGASSCAHTWSCPVVFIVAGERVVAYFHFRFIY